MIVCLKEIRDFCFRLRIFRIQIGLDGIVGEKKKKKSL
jgi:hypothetical protein